MVKNNEEISAIFSAMNDLDPLMNNYWRVLKKKMLDRKEHKQNFFYKKNIASNFI